MSTDCEFTTQEVLRAPRTAGSVKLHTRHLNQLRLAESGRRARDRARLASIERDLDRLVDALLKGVPAERVRDRMAGLEAEKAALEAQGARDPETASAPLLHPSMAGTYRRAVANLREALLSGTGRQEAMEAIRSLIDRITLLPAESRAGGFEVEIEGDLAGILGVCQESKKAAGLTPGGLMQMKLVAGTGFGFDRTPPATFPQLSKRVGPPRAAAPA